MRVKNINGTSDNICKCGSWLKHWENFSDQALPSYCPEKTCVKKAEVGAHVQKDSSIDSSWYIIPLCTMHNAERGKSIDISNGIELVSANVEETCGR